VSTPGLPGASSAPISGQGFLSLSSSAGHLSATASGTGITVCAS
jgi:hypothetical protein